MDAARRVWCACLVGPGAANKEAGIDAGDRELGDAGVEREGRAVLL